MSEQAVIDCLAFAQDARVLEGVAALQDFTRLRDALTNPAGALRYRITGGVGHMRRRFLKLELQADLELQCQRCLQDCTWPLVVKAQIWLARHEDELAAWDREADGLEDAMLADEQFDWMEWIEEEMLLALPTAPIHLDNACPASIIGAVSSKRPNPFAVLAALKQKN
jgi:uncharacterized protein